MLEISTESGLPASDRAGPLRILVAEDGKNVARLLAAFFEMEGMLTALAFNGKEAVETAAAFKPNIICMDLNMPEMDGFEAAARIRAACAEVVLVALSGLDTAESRKRSAECGFNDYLVKPVSPDDLRGMIHAWTCRSPAAVVP